LTPLTSDSIKHKAKELGFDLCGVAPVDSFPELSFLREWLDRGYAGEMAWMTRSADRRADVRHVVSGARSVVVTGTLYNTDRPYSDDLPEDVARISRYAWGDDYHDVLKRGWTRCSRGCAPRPRSRSTRARTSTPVLFRSVSTRSMPALAGSARTRA
jgi:epoxyqueuosine reductase QueG